MQGILSDDARSLANGQEVLRHERVAAERDLEIVDEVHDEQQHGRDKEAEPGAVRGKISEGHKQCDRQQVQQVDLRHMQVGAEAAAGEVQRADHLQQHVQTEHGRGQQQDRQQPADGRLPLLRAQPLAQAALFRGAHVRMRAFRQAMPSARKQGCGPAPWCRGRGRSRHGPPGSSRRPRSGSRR